MFELLIVVIGFLTFVPAIQVSCVILVVVLQYGLRSLQCAFFIALYLFKTDYRLII